MAADSQRNFNNRFRMRVLLPGAVILLVTAIVCGGTLIAAGRGTDTVSLMGQQLEVMRATARAFDDLSLAQESIGLCEECIAEAASADPNEAWLNENVGFRLFDLNHAHETYIINGADRPVYASVERRPTPASAYDRVAPAVDHFVKLARGEIKRPSGRSNLNERLPGSPPEPLEFPPVPGYSDEPVMVFPTVRTTQSVVHATDLVRIGDRIAIISAMPIARVDKAGAAPPASAPVLINLRYLDDAFLLNASKENYLLEARLSDSPATRDGETSTPLTNTDMEPLTHILWKPMPAGAMVINALLLPAAGVFGVIALLVLLMSLRIRALMKRDDEHLLELKQAHLELKAKEAQAHHLAYHDVLTGLPNRALFNDAAEQALTRARHGETMAILLLDLDRFKNVNDRFGHFAGDTLIQEVAKRLSRVIDRPDAVARLGGDEFAVLLQPEELEQGIESILDQILEDLHRPYDILGNQAHVGVSIGVALAPDYGTDRTDLMRKADIALYRAKDEGRDCYRFFTDSMDETVQLRAALESELRMAIETGIGLSVHYQPLIDSKGGKVSGLEALLRWHHPTRGWIAPQLFVPVAEETGLICALGDWVLGEACKVATEWPELSVSVNLSPIQFCDEGFAERTCAIVREAGVRANQIEFEVTEGIVLDQNEGVQGGLRRLRSEGFRIALDDFGTGYSSLSYLRDFEVDRIKIDRSFVQGLGHTVDAEAIVTAVVTLGHAMGLQVTAEGVETADQEDFLRGAGCNVLQGFLFSRAVPAHQLRGALPGRRVDQAA
jgi:diguanylate cyclase (GGDEF)-like protein